MKVIDKAALATPRSALCEYCGRYCRKPTERHHIICRGMGGGKRMDVPENLIDLGGPWDCECHEAAQAAIITPEELLNKVAKREGRTVAWLKDFLNRLYLAPKGSSVDELRAQT